MPVYIDNLFTAKPKNKQAQRHGTSWCHLWTDEDDLTKLHEMAFLLGLRRAYFQANSTLPHYDLTPNKRKAAIKNGVIERSAVDYIRQKISEKM